LTIDHGDTRDLVFKPTGLIVQPLLLGTDGGLHRTEDRGLNWNFTGGGVNGYNALQITEVKGQWIDDIGRYDLYFGTQDNNVLASTDLGDTWPNAVSSEGFFIEMQKRVATGANSQVNFVACGSCTNMRSGPALVGATNWANPPGSVAGNPAIVGRSFHVQGVNAEAGFAAGLAVTRDLGATWSQYTSFPEQRYDLPKLSRHREFRSLGLPVQYQSIRTGFDSTLSIEIDHLVRLSKNLTTPTASVYYPAMNGFGGFGINPTMFAWYQVFGVDPTDSRFIIAPDIINEKMMQTSDGGENWTDIPALTALVTDGGRYQFRNWVFPHASAVSYYGRDASMVAVGTHENGIMLSTDHGATWTKIPGSERATYITSLEWRTASDVIVSTYGRGLWRMKGVFKIPHFGPLCRIVGCLIKWIDRGDPPPDSINPGIVIFEGRAQGVRAERGRVAEVFVSPGSSVGFIGSPERAPKVKITESRRVIGLRGSVRGLKAWPADKAQVVALALDSSNGLRGFALAHAELPISEPVAAPAEVAEVETEQPPERSPTAGKPYLTLSAPGREFERLLSGERMTVEGRRFPPGVSVEVLVNGEVIEKAAVGDDGNFIATIKSPQVPGVHTLIVRDVTTKRVIDGSQFKVNRGEVRTESEQRESKREREGHGEHEEDERAGEHLRIQPPKRGH
jgi:hypothetical protein